MNRVMKEIAASADDIAFSFYLYGRSYIEPGQGVMMLKADYKSQSVPDTISLFNVFPYNNEVNDTCFYSTPVSYYDALTLVDVSLKFTYKKNDTNVNVSEKNNEYNHLSLASLYTAYDAGTPITQRISTVKLDSAIAVILKNENVVGDYVYGIRKKDSRQFEYTAGAVRKGLIDKAQYSTYLFSDVPFVTPYELKIYIDHPGNIIGRPLVYALSISSLIILLLIAAFIFFAYTVLRQKKLSEMKTDFINNMTHEFMTPVTNISLALETLEKKYDPEVLNIIGTENNLLKDNINKVLQVAILEKGSFILELTTINIHDILKRVARNFSQQLQERNGAFHFDLQAANSFINADETHIINMFYNIIDNAIKYSFETPQITIGTGTEKGRLKVIIADNGIGMGPAVKAMIFDRFYRGHTGNRHDVKGFGLGLTYVKSIADAHSILIDVTSNPGKGTTFTFWF